MAHWLFLPNEAIEDLETLASLSKEKVLKLRDLLDSGEIRTRYSFYVKAGELLGISDEAAAKLCTFIKHVQGERAKNEMAAEEIPVELKYFVKKSVKSSEIGQKLLGYIQGHSDVLVSLFSDQPAYEQSAKTRGLELGPLPHVTEFKALCDLRPVYNPKGDKILKCFPVVILSIVAHNSKSDETTNTVVQIRESDIKSITEQFARLEKKLGELKSRFASFMETGSGTETGTGE